MSEENIPQIPAETQPPAEAITPAGLPWSDDKYREWKGRIDRARARREKYDGWNTAADKAYAPAVGDDVEQYGTDISTKRIFTIVERKLAELFYQKPELTVAASPLLEEMGEVGQVVASTHGDILNEKLGLDGVNVKRLAQRACFDYLLYFSSWSVMGYRAYVAQVPQTDPITGMTTTQPVPVKSECFWENISPKQALVPDDWTSTDFDKSPWLGWDFKLPLNVVKRWVKLPEDFSGSTTATKIQFDRGDGASTASASDMVTGTQLWYRSSVFRDDVIHPDHLTELVLIDGLDTPAKHEDCALQKFNELGELTVDSLIGYPMHALVIRQQTDAAYVMSDVTHWRPLEAELNKGREQMIRQRDGNLAKFWGNSDAGKDIFDKITFAAQNQVIVLPPELYNTGAIKPIERAGYPPENFEFNNYLDTDLARASAVDATASGTSAESGLTATEANLRQANVNVRLGWEQGFVADWFVQGATKYSCILQQFLSLKDASAIVGTERAQLWDTMRKQVPVRFAFTMTPDSSLRNDTPLERKMLQDVYSFLAKDPSLNRDYLNRKLLQKYHLDPSRAIIPADKVPQPQPEPVVPTGSLKDLAILANPVVLAFIKANPQWKINIPPEVMGMVITQAAQAEAGMPPHGGKLAPAESMDKHASDLTGAQNGSGQLDGGGSLGGGVVQ